MDQPIDTFHMIRVLSILPDELAMQLILQVTPGGPTHNNTTFYMMVSSRAIMSPQIYETSVGAPLLQTAKQIDK